MYINDSKGRNVCVSMPIVVTRVHRNVGPYLRIYIACLVSFTIAFDTLCYIILSPLILCYITLGYVMLYYISIKMKFI
jgi:hypothetical protein